MKKAFTLIELLIVVAIIAILAAIAVPNFLEAQVRAKVSRTQNDMRSLATAIEAYTVDYNRPLTCATVVVNGVPTGFTGRSVFYEDVNNAVSHRFIKLTTPVAYMTSVLRDPFVNQKNLQTSTGGTTQEYDTYDYFDAKSIVEMSALEGSGRTSGAAWRLVSAGPDIIQMYGAGYVGLSPSNSPLGCDYDPTNGTKSSGDVVRVGGGPGPAYTDSSANRMKPVFDRIQNKWNGW